MDSLDQSRSLKYFLILFGALCLISRGRIRPFPKLVDLQEHVGDILIESRWGALTQGQDLFREITHIVVSREDNKKSARGRRQKEQALFGKGIWI